MTLNWIQDYTCVRVRVNAERNILGFKGKHEGVLEWPSQSPNLNPAKNKRYDSLDYDTRGEHIKPGRWRRNPSAWMYQIFQETCSCHWCKRGQYKTFILRGVLFISFCCFFGVKVEMLSWSQNCKKATAKRGTMMSNWKKHLLCFCLE